MNEKTSKWKLSQPSLYFESFHWKCLHSNVTFSIMCKQALMQVKHALHRVTVSLNSLNNRPNNDKDINNEKWNKQTHNRATVSKDSFTYYTWSCSVSQIMFIIVGPHYWESFQHLAPCMDDVMKIHIHKDLFVQYERQERQQMMVSFMSRFSQGQVWASGTSASRRRAVPLSVPQIIFDDYFGFV